ncbi:MAG TPA: phosphoribosylamine--glycine ligase [Methylomirabilota bacterium]|jgi:phosphoribosylamine--glycine ligase|nr:phosphoribosylamine--glycine ligase [Methylomirabilota bacterium]
MKILVIGGGGREHALVWKVRQSPRVTQVYCAPGNAGIGELAELASIAPDNISGLLQFAQQKAIDLTVVGPEAPLTLGLVDEFEKHGLRVFGPNRQAAQLEGSKAFAKALMKQYGAPTAAFATFADLEKARSYVLTHGAPVVVKADGLAAGKGVFVCATVEEALMAIEQIMHARVFGDAGNQVVIEEFLEGEEASFLAFTDGTTVLPLASSQDHKRVFDHDQGPNTGGMGAYSPAPVVTPLLADRIVNEVMLPVVQGLKQRGIVYKGIIYAGLMIHGDQIKVLEFNVRFGDPECQPLMLRLRSDLVEVIEAVIDERLAEVTLSWDPRPAVCVVVAAEGYPGAYETGKPISGLETLRTWTDGVVFHAGTAKIDNTFVTKGGRVLGVTAAGANIQEAIAEAYRAVEKISWPGMHYRRDIGQRALRR